jgi:glucuronoarabinoxylan endo-1,4-beta-xylanase
VTCGGGTAAESDVVLDLSDVHQIISGFGASTAWEAYMSTADADLLWSTTTGAGLSLHRVRIDYQTGQTSEAHIAQLAVAHGVTVWAAPWTPPVADKSNGSEVEGTLTDGQAFATFLTGFVTYMKGLGVDIYAVSAQNEPDANVTYESCAYSAAQMTSFVGTYLGPAFAGTGVKVMAPETQNWCSFGVYQSSLQADSTAWGFTDIVATHEYGCTPSPYPSIQAAGKEFWETEVFDRASSTADPGMASGLRVARLIHDALTIASVNAWHYWWVYPLARDNQGLWDLDSGKPSKRLWVEGNYARFVRPGYQRVGTEGTAPDGVFLSAYTSPSDGTVVVVAINDNDTATPVSLYLPPGAPCTFTPWVTSASDSLASQTDVSVASSHLTLSLEPQSVTTFVGKP